MSTFGEAVELAAGVLGAVAIGAVVWAIITGLFDKD